MSAPSGHTYQYIQVSGNLYQWIKEQLHDQNDDEEVDGRILVVWGLGGASKSQLVLHYIQEYRKDYTGVFWIEAGSKETIERNYVQIYRLLYDWQTGLGQETTKVEDAVPAFKRWFQDREGRWLVLDSADTIDNEQDRSYINLDHFLPDAPGVHVIVTTAVREITQLEAVEVADMEPPEATELFQRSAKMIEAGPDERRGIGMIVKELGHLALAITLAASYVSVTPRLSSDIKKFLPEYRERWKEVLQRRPKQYIHRLFEKDGLTTLPGDSAHTANGSDAAALSDRAWRSYLSQGHTWTRYDLESAFETLQSYSLIQWRSDQRSYSMHKRVHAWGHDRLEVEQQRRLSFLALELMADRTTEEGVDPSQQVRLVPHIMASFGASSGLYEPPDENAQDILAMIDKIERFLYRIGRWLEAYEIQLFHLTKMEMISGKEHPSTLTSMNNLAAVSRSQGKYEEAEEIHRQTLALSESVLGKKHPYTLTSMNNLALVLNSQGKYEEAEGIHRQTLALRGAVLGKKGSPPHAIRNTRHTVVILLDRMV